MSNKIRGIYALLTLFILFAQTAVYLYAQEESLPVEAQALTPEQKRIDMDIKTSTLSELAAWCRSLGLPEGGTSADLARRLRDYFKVKEQALPGEDKRKIITIESARSTEYFTIETVNEDYARLNGEVMISLKDGDAIHQIRAWHVLFNRTRNILTASGGVEYKKTEGDTVETFRGDSITVDLDNWSSVFLGGVSERSLKSDNTTYQFAGTVISHDEEDVTVISKATIRSANNEESLWSLSASRVWLLPGSDFAILNAVLKVGKIPVLYIPFFYYPADQLIFHPVIGSRTREGSFVQTTTYILGRPKASSTAQSSLTKILGSSNDIEKKREGLFLRSTGKKIVEPDKISLKALVDYYTNLGGYFGLELNLPPAKKVLLSALNLSLGIGVTRTIVPASGGGYTPFFPPYEQGGSDWNKSNLFSAEVPFRYRFRTDSSIGGKYGSFSWNLPYYSDPLVDSDFLDRAEDMDWVNLVQQGANAMEAVDTAQNYLGTYIWQFSTQIKPVYPNMAPYITGISISSISSTVAFKTVDVRPSSSSDPKYYSPSSWFYAPDTATLYSLNGSIAGTPLTVGGNAASQAKAKTKDTELPDPLKDIGVPRSPFEDKKKEDTQKKDVSEQLVPPELTQRFNLPRIGNVLFSVDYRVAPSSASTLRFDSNRWKAYNDIDWSNVTSVLTSIGGDASTTLNFNHTENLFSNSFSYNANGTWRSLSLNEESSEFLTTLGEKDEAKIETTRKNELKQSFFSTSYSLSSTLRPLYWNSMFQSSSLQYTLRGLAVRSRFKDDSTADNPEWDIITGKWKKEGTDDNDKGITYIEAHQFTTNISALIMDKSQTFSFSFDLPPRDPMFSWRASFNIWRTTTEANMSILFPLDNPTEEEISKGRDKLKLEPFNLTERINFGVYGSFSQSLSLDTEERELISLTSSLNLSKWGISASFSAARMLGYEYIPEGSDPNNPAFSGWRTRKGEAKAGDPEYKLKPRDLRFGFAKSVNILDLWNKRMQLTFNINTQLNFDLQQYTNSNFLFSLGFTTSIYKFLDLTMSIDSRNTVIYRYFRNVPPFNSAPIEIEDRGFRETNLFYDLINSFKFGNKEAREISGFKMGNFRMLATHYLGDWNAILNWTVSPYRPAGSRRYEMNNEVSFLLQWVPIKEIKSDISYNKSNNPEWTIKH